MFKSKKVLIIAVLFLSAAFISSTVIKSVSASSDYDVFQECWWKNTTSDPDCTNRDFDGDGFVGPNDSTLFGEAIATYDLNGDGVVNYDQNVSSDYDVFNSCWYKNVADTPDCVTSDFDGDGFVGSNDSTMFGNALSTYDLNGDGVVNASADEIKSDLIITDIESKIEVGALAVNNLPQIKFIYRVHYKNIGQGNVKNDFNITLSDSLSGLTQTAVIQINTEMNSNEERYEDILFIDTSIGYRKFDFNAQIDTEYTVNETDENNNVYLESIDIIIYDWELSDLVLDNVTNYNDENLPFQYKISNNSKGGQLPAYHVDLYWNGTLIGELANWPQSQALGFGENALYHGELDGVYVRSGNHELKLVLAINGSDDVDNNTLTKTITINDDNSSLPDLIIKDILEYEGKIRVKYSNIGSGNAQEGFKISLSDCSGKLTQDGSCSAIKTVSKGAEMNPNEERYEDFEIYGDGILNLLAKVDDSNIIDESNENNNTLTKTIILQENNQNAEQVKCIFENSDKIQECYLAGENDKYKCSGTETCVINVFGEKGDKLTWKSTCGNYAYTVIDGDNDYAKFNCAQDAQITNIISNANLLYDDKFGDILLELKELRDIVKEQAIQIKYLTRLKEDVQALSSKVENAINNFITYGVDYNTKRLGAGERAAVMYSFKSAFKKLPETEDELADAIKIANGRWPSLRSEEAEKAAKEQFKKIYEKVADMNNPNDNAAVTVMAYGLRQRAENRNLDSERNGIKIFQDIYGYHPDSTEDWNIMQAITYSGSSRGVDTDGDLLLDEREVELGTDPNNPDTDGDGYKDGEEVANGYNPLGEGRM